MTSNKNKAGLTLHGSKGNSITFVYDDSNKLSKDINKIIKLFDEKTQRKLDEFLSQ
ncbi:MAG: hypothetical protein ACFE9S_20390 [Candidatus Hermodarchaeota archaeon]